MADFIAEGRSRLDEIIESGAALLRTKRSGDWGMDSLSDQAAYEKWRLTGHTVLRMLDPTGDHRKEFEAASNKPVTWGYDYPRKIEQLLAILEAFREDFDRVRAMPRRPPEPPPIQIRMLTPQEIEVGIAKLRRRVEEIQKLGTDRVSHDDGQKESIEAKVRNTICETFGENSPQFRDNEHFEIHKGLLYAGASSAEHQKWFMDGIAPAVTLLKGLVSDLEEQREFAAPVATAPAAKPSAPSRRVFVVHGHDDAANDATARFLTALDFEPIILHEQPNGGRTLIEKFEKYSDVAFAVVLLTPDDVAHSKKKPTETHDRARQNVVFELGLFIGKLGRANVCPLVKGDMEQPSDYDGVAYVKMDPGDGWKLTLAREMKEAGLAIDGAKLIAA